MTFLIRGIFKKKRQMDFANGVLNFINRMYRKGKKELTLDTELTNLANKLLHDRPEEINIKNKNLYFRVPITENPINYQALTKIVIQQIIVNSGVTFDFKSDFMSKIGISFLLTKKRITALFISNEISELKLVHFETINIEPSNSTKETDQQKSSEKSTPTSHKQVKHSAPLQIKNASKKVPMNSTNDYLIPCSTVCGQIQTLIESFINQKREDAKLSKLLPDPNTANVFTEMHRRIILSSNKIEKTDFIEFERYYDSLFVFTQNQSKPIREYVNIIADLFNERINNEKNGHYDSFIAADALLVSVFEIRHFYSTVILLGKKKKDAAVPVLEPLTPKVQEDMILNVVFFNINAFRANHKLNHLETNEVMRDRAKKVSRKFKEAIDTIPSSWLKSGDNKVGIFFCLNHKTMLVEFCNLLKSIAKVQKEYLLRPSAKSIGIGLWPSSEHQLVYVTISE